MPLQRRCKLRYCEQQINLVGTTGALASYVFRANSIYDPNFTGVGHSPMGYDQWAVLYNHYTVVGSKITVKFDNSGGTGASCNVGVYLSDHTTVPYTQASEFIEARKGTTKLITNQRNVVSASSWYSAKKFYNVKDIKDNFARLGGVTGANPTEQAVFIVWLQSAASATTVNCNVTATIEYIVDWSEPTDLSQS